MRCSVPTARSSCAWVSAPRAARAWPSPAERRRPRAARRRCRQLCGAWKLSPRERVTASHVGLHRVLVRSSRVVSSDRFPSLRCLPWRHPFGDTGVVRSWCRRTSALPHGCNRRLRGVPHEATQGCRRRVTSRRRQTIASPTRVSASGAASAPSRLERRHGSSVIACGVTGGCRAGHRRFVGRDPRLGGRATWHGHPQAASGVAVGRAGPRRLDPTAAGIRGGGAAPARRRPALC